MADSDGSRRDPAGLGRGLGRIAGRRTSEPLSGPDLFVLYRILGNDLALYRRKNAYAMNTTAPQPGA